MYDSSKRQRFYVSIVIIGILIPLISVFLSHIETIDPLDILFTVKEQLFAPEILKGLIIQIILLITTISVLLFSSILLFDTPKKASVEPADNKLEIFLRRFTPKKQWHVLLGYFLTITAIHPVIAHSFTTSYNVDNYPAMIVTSLIIATALLIARILSKFSFTILDTPLGIFIILVYISEVIYIAMSATHIPFSHFQYFFSNDRNTVFDQTVVYTSEIFATITITVLDRMIIRKGLNSKTL